MNKLFSKIATLSVGLAMAIGVGVALGSNSAKEVRAIDTDVYDVSTTALTSLSAGTKVVWGVGDQSLVAKDTISSNWLRMSGTVSEWTIFEIEESSDSFYLKNGSNYIYSSAVKKMAFDSSNKTAITLGTNGVVEASGLGVYVYNANNGDGGIRPYATVGQMENTYLFEVTEKGEPDVLESITVSGSMSKTSYTTAESWDASGLVATGTYQTAGAKDITNKVTWSFNPATPSVSVTSVVATATLGTVSGSSSAQAVTVEEVVAPITLNSSNWPMTGSSASDNVQEVTYDGIVYQNVRGYIYSNKLSLQYKVDSYFGNKTPYSRNIKSIVITYDANITSYVKMYEGDEPLAKTSQVTQSGTTTVTYTFSDTRPYFRLNMDTKLPNKTYCNITSIVITFGSAADVVDLEDISLNENKTLPVGVTFASVLTLDPANANNKDTIAWSSSNSSVATVDNSGVVTTVGVGEATITATATDLVGVSASYVVSTFTATPIEKLYYMADGSAVDFNGVYVGTITGSGPVVMNGEYGILLYSTMDTSSYEEGTTILHVTGTLAIFSGLYEVKNPVVDVLESAEDVADPVTYSVTGGETYIHENRRTYVSGTVTSVSGSWTSDTTVVMNVGGNSIQCFAKANSISSEDQAKIVADAVLTLKGFSGWHNGFQVTITGTVEESSTYTAEDFAQDLIDATDAVCVNYVDGESSYAEFKAALTTVWTNLQAEDKYQALPGDQKEALGEASREGSSIINQAMKRYDFLTGKYKLDNFITGRTPMAFAFTGFDNLTETNNTMIIVISIAAVSALAFTLLLVFKKKKHN